MYEDRFVFKNLSTGVYFEGAKASDYLPMHDLKLLEYDDYDIILRLIIYSPNGIKEESLFAWVEYRPDENGEYILDDVYAAIFDESKEAHEQELPVLDVIGLIVLQKLNGMKFW